MTQQELLDFIRPFQPIEVCLDNGERFAINHPAQILVAPTTVIVLSQENRLVKFSMRKIAKIEMSALDEAEQENR